MTLRRTVLSLVAAALLIGCSGPLVPTELDEGVGVIVGLDRSTSFPHGGLTIWVKEDLESECGVVYGITDDTRITRRSRNGGLRPADVGDLEVGTLVRVATGIILLSCPGQASADAVEIVET